MSEAKVRQQYDRLADIYDRRWHSYVTDTLSFLNTWAELSPQARVLDVACGTGEFEQVILAENPTQSIIGVDISEKMLAIARHKCRNYSNAVFQTASASLLPFADRTFDVVISANAFHYFDRPETALSEMKRVLKPDGRVIILDWCKDYFLCRLCDRILPLFDSAYKQCYTQDEFHRLLIDVGFEIQRDRRVHFGLLWGLMVATATKGGF
ncbi:class I SAM-dependent methyltransferase [Mastigocladopsis repens]|uniref:class I SAM-dependent methyltransferase n=1 Tax=Mastigocladopsis repens TaxID=221287 RepID=UPI000301DD28|nr:methyltransferase domain-containing protein [Mastigocladopsis repens]